MSSTMPKFILREPTISIVIPTLNEAKNLPHVFEKLPGDAEIVLVDGRSTDGTIDAARSLRADVVVVHQTRKGKGNALACGFAAATGDIIVMLDADGSADAKEIEAFTKALKAGAHFAKGSRFMAGGGSEDITRIRRLGNRFLSFLVNSLFRCRYSDLCYGYNAFWRTCLPVLGLDAGTPAGEGDSAERRWGDGFEIETMINLRVAKAGLQVIEVPSFEYSRIHGVSNLNAISDGLRVLRTIVSERRRSRAPLAIEATLPAQTLPAGVTAIGPSERDPGAGIIRQRERADGESKSVGMA
ncbi:glycosyltransferase family 2 protein [Frankia sp. AgB1.9]|uniref:glycosyltransferase family 2 protein n=1 Tax=unclassified Frankia TaxID=2632575 RepID=UPI001934037C|nr:glycosyltransferase family 2 protein [Frankia sp. AgW1.1]MBL7552539.1 glycosyltransferase family 2 protein [Frankia sp. AgB1.9]MBL7624746.1 glycosyltransferase family 2 protein [Frankia sp. AgB1.8]